MEFLDDAQGESPFVRDLQARGLIRVAETKRVEIPYRVQEVRIGRSLDLRQPRVQAWLQERVSKKGLPGALFEYPTHVSQRLTWLQAAADDGAPSDTLESADGLSFNGVAITFGPCDSWDQSRYAGPDDFMGLLPYLIFGTRGGSPVTDAIGRWFRASGVEALIYPSARNDVACEVRGERLVCATGWIPTRAQPSLYPVSMGLSHCLRPKPAGWSADLRSGAFPALLTLSRAGSRRSHHVW